MLAIYYYCLSRRMAYETTTQVTHGTSALLLHLYSLASCFLEDEDAYLQLVLSIMAADGFIFAIVVASYCEPFEIATRYPHDGEVSAQELELYRRWAMPEFLIFVDASEFYLPAIDAAVDLRDFKTAAAREDHDSDVQTLRVNTGHSITTPRRTKRSAEIHIQNS
ncbi:hypothetical protein BDP27DRAFT_1323660 [Rhodocollybia butyracea]|uniref:Uncharacterized protein n=1 Tax=Rhodocollybia butyracea TaxID=206335 RepID=A0A9P5U9W4_9AGAR|nr:hypothetical protein BDP27DRAFT_1323660 [Rhodocollybia butyracea]